MTLTYGSACSGYEGLGMALDLWLGPGVAQPQWFAEVDPDASRVLKTWWSEVPNLGDFTVPGWTAERCDVELGGVPCQGFSAAGRQLGAADPRHLWPDWRRGIAERRPATVIFENVANLTRGKMRPIFDGIIADLLALGYDVRWCLLGACAVGAAHHRHRVFLLACRSRTTPNARQVTVQTCGQSVAAYLPTPTARDASTRGEGGPEFWEAKRATGWTGGVPLGAALSLLPTPAARDGGPRDTGGDAARRQAMGRGGNPGVHKQMDPPTTLQLLPELWDKYAEAIARHESVLGRPAPEPTEIGPKGGRRLAAAFSEWLMMLPQGHLTSVLDRNPALARAGNGVVPLQAATALRLLFDGLRG